MIRKERRITKCRGSLREPNVLFAENNDDAAAIDLQLLRLP